MKEKKRNTDILLIAAILVIACVLFIGNFFLFRRPAAQVELSVDGKVVATLPLDKDTEITVDGFGQGNNHLIIQDGQVWIDEATCPDKVCVHQGKIPKNSNIIVCLPNKMFAKIIGIEE